MKVRLPLNLDEVWERSSDNCFSWGSRYRMAYFTYPMEKGCKLVEGVDYFTADGAITQETRQHHQHRARLRAADQRQR